LRLGGLSVSLELEVLAEFLLGFILENDCGIIKNNSFTPYHEALQGGERVICVYENI
jgi:hypothetical protein